MNIANDGSIRILGTLKPQGTESLWICQAWVGLILPIESEVDGHYLVNFGTAVNILGKVDSEAAEYWLHSPVSWNTKRLMLKSGTAVFAFPKDAVEFMGPPVPIVAHCPGETQMSLL